MPRARDYSCDAARVASQVGRWIVSMIVTGLLALSAWTAYVNVFSDDTPLRARAEKLARETARCVGTCTLTRVDGARGILKETLTFTFETGVVVVACKRPYVAFGDHHCSASKP